VHNVDGDVSNLAEHTAKIVAAKPDLIFTVGTAITTAAQRATATIPIVFTYVAEPQKFGITANFTSSENNLTGVSHYAARVSGKRLEILKEIAPHITSILTIVSANERVAEESFRFLQEAAEKLAVHTVRRDVTEKGEIEQILRALPQGSVDAVYHIPSSLVGANIDQLIAKAREDKLPMVVHESAMVEKGALVSYGSDARLTGIQAAELMVMILQGTKPADIPIQIPEQLHLAVNLSTARAISLKIPRNLLERVDQLVE
jgi:putative ABC transport system substrate-binding protein